MLLVVVVDVHVVVQTCALAFLSYKALRYSPSDILLRLASDIINHSACSLTRLEFSARGHGTQSFE